MTISSVTREYLEAIYNLIVEGEPVVGARLAEKFGVSAPTWHRSWSECRGTNI